MTVGDRIRQQLKEVGISQSELARRVGVSQPTINGLIHGNARSSVHLHRIARELRTTPAYLTGETDDPSEAADESLSAEERDWIDLLRAIAPQDRKSLLSLARTIAASAASPQVHDKQQTFRAAG